MFVCLVEFIHLFQVSLAPLFWIVCMHVHSANAQLTQQGCCYDWLFIQIYICVNATVETLNWTNRSTSSYSVSQIPPAIKWFSSRFCCALKLFFLSPGWLHVHPRWCGEHPWEQEDWLSVQNLARCSQPAGALLGAASQIVSPPDFSPHLSSVQPGPHGGACGTLEISTKGAQTRESWKGWAGQWKDELLENQIWFNRFWDKTLTLLPDVAPPQSQKQWDAFFCVLFF